MRRRGRGPVRRARRVGDENGRSVPFAPAIDRGPASLRSTFSSRSAGRKGRVPTEVARLQRQVDPQRAAGFTPCFLARSLTAFSRGRFGGRVLRGVTNSAAKSTSCSELRVVTQQQRRLPHASKRGLANTGPFNIPSDAARYKTKSLGRVDLTASRIDCIHRRGSLATARCCHAGSADQHELRERRLPRRSRRQRDILFASSQRSDQLSMGRWVGQIATSAEVSR